MRIVVPTNNRPPEFGCWPSIYANGFVGCFVDADTQPEWAREIARYESARHRANAKYPYAAPICGAIAGSGKGKRANHYNFFAQIDPTAMMGSQDYGNCTAWSWRCCVGCVIGVDIKLKGEPHQYRARPGTAVTYGLRGHSGAGMAVSTAARVGEHTGIQVMDTYCDEKYDFRNEDTDEKYGNDWGRRGPPDDLLEEIKSDKILIVSKVSPEADIVQDLLHNGYFIHVGSSLTALDHGDPISRLGTPASHAEALIGYDDTDEMRDRLGLKRGEWVSIWDQSWGTWNRVTGWPEDLWGPKPEGAFVLSGKDTIRKLKQGEVYAYSDVDGFPARDLPDWGSHEYL